MHINDVQIWIRHMLQWNERQSASKFLQVKASGLYILVIYKLWVLQVVSF